MTFLCIHQHVCMLRVAAYNGVVVFTFGAMSSSVLNVCSCCHCGITYTLYSAGLLSDPSESSDMANSVQDSDGLCFIPAFSGIQVNYSASTMCDRNEVD